MISPASIIRCKRDGGVLTAEQIGQFVSGVRDHRVSEAQIAAFTMAIYLNGMTESETVDLTLAMRDSGQVLRWNDLPGPVLDKHSTVGVGCTGGRHRSVAMARALAERLVGEPGVAVRVRHRDLGRE